MNIFSSTINSLSGDIQSNVASNIRKNPNIYEDVANAKTKLNQSMNMDSYQKSSLALNDARLSISNTKGYLGYNILNLTGISQEIKKATIDYMLENEKIDSEFTTIEELFELYPEIDDELVISILQLAETVEKPKSAEGMDDLQWGMLLSLGEEIGMRDKDGLMQITQQDLKIYYDLRNNRSQENFDIMGNTDQNGELVKQYEKPEDIWKDIFLTDDNGNFLRDKAGNLIRNEEFTYSTVAQESVVPYNDLYFEFYTSESFKEIGMRNMKLTDYSAADLMNLALCIKSGNDTGFAIIANREHPGDAEPYYIKDLAGAETDAEKLVIYKRFLAIVHENFMNDLHRHAAGMELQKNETPESLKSKKWVTFNPNGSESYITEHRKAFKS